MRQEKAIKTRLIEEEETKITIFVGNMVVHTINPKDSCTSETVMKTELKHVQPFKEDHTKQYT